RECDNCPSSVLLSPSFPFVMHGIMVGSFHRLTCAAQCSRSFDQSYPRCEGVALASVTLSRRAYMPELVERDPDRLPMSGMNAWSRRRRPPSTDAANRSERSRVCP